MSSVADAMTPQATLPKDGTRGALAGRVWLPDVNGPAVVAVRADGVYDISSLHRPCAICARLRMPQLSFATARASGSVHWRTFSPIRRKKNAITRKPWLLAPNDLQAIKAAGVTFPLSMLERVIEEQARGAPEKAAAIRASVATNLGGDIRKLVPGSAQAAELKRVLIEQGAWSQYLEVGIGPDAEIFTKGQPMSAVGHGMEAGLHPISTWNNPEPEVVLVVNPRARSSAPRSATTSTCATSKGARRCCCPRPRTTTRRRPSGHSCASSTASSRSIPCAAST